MSEDYHNNPLFYGDKLIAAGYRVFPLNPRNKAPSVSGGFYAATDDPQKLGEWLMGDLADHNVGIATGAISGVVVVDADSPEQKERMTEKFGPPQVETRRGGHWYFRYPGDGKVDSRGIEDKLDRKADGGYVEAPPSPGKVWTAGIPEKSSLSPLPDEFRVSRQSAEDLEEFRKGERLDRETIRSASKVIARYVSKMGRGNQHSNRHSHMLSMCRVLLEREVDDRDAEEVLVGAWRLVGGSLEKRADREVRNNLNSTAERLRNDEPASGVPEMEKATPGLFEDLQRVFGWVGDIETLTVHSGGSQDEPGDNGATRRERPKGRPKKGELQVIFRRAFFERYPNVRRSSVEWRKYDEGIWVPIEEGWVRLQVDRMIDETEGVPVTSTLVNSVAQLVSNRAFVPAERWDHDESIIVCRNGVLRLPAMTFEDHSPRHYALAKLPFDYDPDAAADAWAAVGARLNPSVWEYLQNFVGYSLTTDCSHEQAIWLVGEMGSGKSTFVEGVQMILGARHGILSLRDLERSPFALGVLPGRTLLTATEQPSDYVSQVDILNAIISGEEVLVDRKYHDPAMVRSTAKILWAMNSPPRITDQASGIWRRIKRVDWPFLDPVSRDEEVKRQIRTEGSGILNWALAGLRRVLDRGLQVPQVVEDSTQAFREESDVEAMFLLECCVRGEDKWVYSSRLYTRYRQWAEDHGYRPKSDQSVGKEWERLGLKYEKNRSGRIWHKVDLRGLDGSLPE